MCLRSAEQASLADGTLRAGHHSGETQAVNPRGALHSLHHRRACPLPCQILSHWQTVEDQKLLKEKELHLEVLMGVPVRVVDDDGVGRGQVDAKAAGTRGEQENKHVRVSVESAHGLLAVLPGNAAVDARGAVAQLLQVRVQEVQHLGHLACTAGETVIYACSQEYMLLSTACMAWSSTAQGRRQGTGMLPTRSVSCTTSRGRTRLPKIL